jgi:molybdopterin molybdotransferase
LVFSRETEQKGLMKPETLLSVEEAIERVLELSAPLAEETVSIEDAIGRALTREIRATRTLPPKDNSAMDGYAVRTADLAAGALPLEIVERIFAGQKPSISLEEGMCARIMTGAELPNGADAVVMQEKVQVLDEERIEVLEVPLPGLNIRRRGEDIHEGSLLLTAGTSIGLGEAGALWGQGLTRVSVARRPRVTIASSGDELCNAWEESHGRIVDTNSPVLAQAVKLAGGIPTVVGVAPDRLEALVANFRRGLDGDVLITVAGASVGDRDFTRDAFAELGVDMDFWKVAMKPGKPLSVGRKDGTLVFGLPGNPVSAMVTFELFCRPALRALQGLQPAARSMPGRTASPLSKAKGLRHFLRATVEELDGALWATPLPNQSSGAISSALGATHLISLDPDVSELVVGSEIKLIPLSWGS